MGTSGYKNSVGKSNWVRKQLLDAYQKWTEAEVLAIAAGGLIGGNGGKKGDNKGTGNTSSIRSKGKPYENHTTVLKTDTVRNLLTTGKPNSSVDFYDEKGTLTQRRYYDKNGRAIEDIDYEHSNGDNSHEFPHRHTWDWSSGSPKKSK